MGKTKKAGILGPAAAHRKQSRPVPSFPVAKKKKRFESVQKHSRSVGGHVCDSRKPDSDNGHERTGGLRLQSPLHQQCATIVARLLRASDTHSKGATVKGLCLAPHVKNKSAVYAVVCETLRHAPILNGILQATGFLSEHPELSEATALVLLYDHLVGQGVRPRSKAERVFLSSRSAFDAEAQKLLRACKGAKTLTDLLPRAAQRDAEPVRRMSHYVSSWSGAVPNALVELQAETVIDVVGRALVPGPWLDTGSYPPCVRLRTPRPRSVRVNALKMTVEAAERQLTAPPTCWPQKHRTALAPERDTHLSDVIFLPPGAPLSALLECPMGKGLDMHDHPLVQSGALILQGKSSCMPAHALLAEVGWHVVDCCAAPGNKTSHVAAHVGLRGRVFAFEKDARRCQVLQATVERAGASHVAVCNADFLAVDVRAAEFSKVRGVILDPSCSGSGTGVTRKDFLMLDDPAPDANACVDDSTLEAAAGESEPLSSTVGGRAGDAAAFPGPTSDNSKRVGALAEFQKKVLRHALGFPGLQRLVYSTCSVFRQENEDVVAAVLPDAAALGFELAHALPQWPRRGLPGLYPWTHRLVRVHPELDNTDGFFVAVFERTGHA